MVHLDVKPDNIFISCERSKHNAPNEDSADDGFEEDSTIDDGHTEFTYKIGEYSLKRRSRVEGVLR